ncbi:ribosome-associated translation inhibitor RaiA [Cryomorpha ignava]|uniref:Ribosome-associated translation inhibitor RaiA n=1 Tax=Cryomorpha ignava TaxID=101383 RepID=A0A7K3WMH5_9FLAO|nr:ribosome-associated translation inhibitor RaiA [Cryomorpha ignava]NEN22847.1 ribosome-associated translation inhibitor RaiA [Cryomorpha ignava]
MQVNVHSIQFKADAKLIDFIQAKLDKLQLFHDKMVAAEVYLKLDKNHELGNKIAEIKINVPGKELFAKRQSNSFEESTDLVIEALRRQIHKLKGKRTVTLS